MGQCKLVSHEHQRWYQLGQVGLNQWRHWQQHQLLHGDSSFDDLGHRPLAKFLVKQYHSDIWSWLCQHDAVCTFDMLDRSKETFQLYYGLSFHPDDYHTELAFRLRWSAC